MRLSKAAVRAYVKQEGVICPYCGGTVIAVGPIEVMDGGRAQQDCDCLDCPKSWTDEYTLTGIRVGRRYYHG